MAEPEPPEPVAPEPPTQADAPVADATVGPRPAVARAPQASVAPSVGSASLESAGPAATEVDPSNRPPSLRQPAAIEPRGRMITLILALFLGSFGVHRFYTGYTTAGLIQLFTAGGCGIWWAVDVTLILMGRFRDAEGKELV